MMASWIKSEWPFIIYQTVGIMHVFKFDYIETL